MKKTKFKVFLILGIILIVVGIFLVWAGEFSLVGITTAGFLVIITGIFFVGAGVKLHRGEGIKTQTNEVVDDDEAIEEQYDEEEIEEDDEDVDETSEPKKKVYKLKTCLYCGCKCYKNKLKCPSCNGNQFK